MADSFDEIKVLEKALKMAELRGLKGDARETYVDRIVSEEKRLVFEREREKEEKQLALEEKKLELEKEKEEKRLALEREKEERKLALEREKEEKKLAVEREREKEKLALEEKKLELEREREREKEKLALEEKKLEREERLTLEREKLARDERAFARDEEKEKREFELRKLEIQAQMTNNVKGQNDNSHRKRRVSKLPLFKEKTDEISAFLARFEFAMKAEGVDEADWPLELASHLEGPALSLFYSVCDEEGARYDNFKMLLLKKYQGTAEDYRKRFRESKPRQGESFDVYGIELKKFFDQWVLLSEAEKSYDGIVDLVLREQFLGSVCKDLAMYLTDKGSLSFDELLASAEVFRLSRTNKVLARQSEQSFFHTSVAQAKSVPRYKPPHARSDFSDRRHSVYQRSSPKTSYQYRAGRDKSFNRKGPARFQTSPPVREKNSKTCILCKREGHAFEFCYWVTGKNGLERCDMCHYCHPLGKCIVMPDASANACMLTQNVACSLVDVSGSLQLDKGLVNNTPCSILRDTGATICGVRERLVHPDQYLNHNVKCVSFGGKIETFPLAKVHIACHYFEGNITCCVIKDPVADLILGNVPCIKDIQSQTALTAAAVVTRAQRKAVESTPLKEAIQAFSITKTELQEFQKNDLTLNTCFELAESGETKIW